MGTGAAVFLAACDPGSGKLSVGGLDNAGQGVGGNGDVGNGGSGGNGSGGSGGSGGGGGSGGSTGGDDMAMAGSDDMARAACTPGSSTTLKTSSIAVGSLALSQDQNYIIGHDSMGFYGMTSVCPHAQCTVNDFSTPGQMVCPCHGASWDSNGQNGQGPRGAAGSTLQHYALCIEADGTITVTSTKATPTDRY